MSWEAREKMEHVLWFAAGIASGLAAFVMGAALFAAGQQSERRRRGDE